MPLHYQSDFHPDLANLCKRLRYILGGYRPSKTTHQTLFPEVFGIRIKIKLGWYLTVVPTEVGTPTYTEQVSPQSNIKL